MSHAAWASQRATADRYRRLLDAVAALVPCDAARLLRLDGNNFVPVATRGLTADTQGRRFARGAHPRLDPIAASPQPIRSRSEASCRIRSTVY